MSKRPINEEELQKREVIGVIRASRFVREYAKSHQPITVETICRIHREIFKDAWPEIAGIFRDENITITGSQHLPPHHAKVPDQMQRFYSQLQERLSLFPNAEGQVFDFDDLSNERLETIGSIIEAAAWVHHQITYIHPFREGNGRTARLATNLILERYGLVGLSIRVEKENKNRYCNALAQADKHDDYQPLIDLIVEGLIERYQGVPMKFSKN